MAKDNTLGAPTEGLGQTVTFAGNAQGGVPQTSAMQRGSLRNSATGGGAQRTAQALQVPTPQGDSLFKTLARLGGEVLKPHLEAERTLKYMEGMQTAASGQAITEIVDEQPWYSQVFGSTSLVDGARAHTAAAKATAIAVDMETNMTTLRKMAPSEFAQYSTKAMQKAYTGDATTDMMLTQQVGQTLPSVMKAQAKEHIRYTQEVFDESRLASHTASFANLRAVAQNSQRPTSTVAADDMVEAELATLRAITDLPDVDQQHQDKLLTSAVVGAVAQGNFAVYDLMHKSKRIEALSPEQQLHIERARHQAHGQAVGSISNDLLQQRADFETMAFDPTRNDDEFFAARDRINTQYTRETGDTQPLVSAGDTQRELQQARAVRLAELNRRLAAEGKAPKASEVKADSEFLLATDLLKSPLNTFVANLPAKEVQSVFDQARVMSGSGATITPPFAHALAGVHGQGVMDKTTSEAMQHKWHAAKVSNNPMQMQQVYTDMYLPLVQAAGAAGDVVAQKYAGGMADEMAQWHAAAKGQKLGERDVLVAFTQAITPAVKPTTSAAKTLALEEIKTGRTQGMLNALSRVLPFVDNRYTERDPERLANRVAPFIKGTRDTAAEIASIKREQRISVIAGYDMQAPIGATTYADWLANPEKNPFTPDGVVVNRNEHQAFDEMVQYAKEVKGISGDATVLQSIDDGGVPTFLVMGANARNDEVISFFTAQEVVTHWKGRTERYNKSMAFGPEPTVGLTPAVVETLKANPQLLQSRKQRKQAEKAARTK